jgi:hypothetical protein
MAGEPDVVLLPMGRSDDGAQYVFLFFSRSSRILDVMNSSVNEKLDEENFFNGVS